MTSAARRGKSDHCGPQVFNQPVLSSLSIPRASPSLATNEEDRIPRRRARHPDPQVGRRNPHNRVRPRCIQIITVDLSDGQFLRRIRATTAAAKSSSSTTAIAIRARSAAV